MLERFKNSLLTNDKKEIDATKNRKSFLPPRVQSPSVHSTDVENLSDGVLLLIKSCIQNQFVVSLENLNVISVATGSNYNNNLQHVQQSHNASAAELSKCLKILH